MWAARYPATKFGLLSPRDGSLRSAGAAHGERPRMFGWLRVLLLLSFAGTAVYYIAVSWRWRLAIDSPVMHYVVFLMRHGMKPYREISDNNMPGAYLVEAAAMQVFGASDRGWRVYEFVLLGAMTLALCRLARGWDWMAGLVAAQMFLVLHANEGPQYSGEREFVLTVLLLLSYAALFRAVDRVRPGWMLLFGLASGLAVSIKPSFLPLPMAVLALALAVLRRRRQPVLAAALAAVLGWVAIFGLTLGFLLRAGVLRDFVFVLRTVTPAYVGLASRIGWRELLAHALPHSGWAFLLLSVPLGVANWRQQGQWSWKQWALLLGVVFGLLSYLVQHKGFSHHRYALCTFAYLLASIEVFRAFRLRGWARPFAAAVLLLMLASIPHALRVAATWSGSSDLELSLEHDLDRMGGAAALQDKVQCFDLVYGCLNALYHEQIVENTGFTGDLLFFPKVDGPATEYYRERYWRAEERDPPSVIVLSNGELMQPNSYSRLERWPEFASYLAANFVEVADRRFRDELFGTHEKDRSPLPPAEQDGYRIYVRRGSALLGRWAAAPQAARF